MSEPAPTPRTPNTASWRQGTDDAATREPEEDDHTVAEDESAAADRIVEVGMSEFAFTPEGNDHGGESGGHDGDIPSVTVEPGEVGEFVHTFTDAEDVMFGYHLPGHWDAGMQAMLEVQG